MRPFRRRHEAHRLSRRQESAIATFRLVDANLIALGDVMFDLIKERPDLRKEMPPLLRRLEKAIVRLNKRLAPTQITRTPVPREPEGDAS